MKIAIVGSQERYWTDAQRDIVINKITEILSSHNDPILVSGHCPKGGVDIWAEKVALDLGIPMEIHYPQVHQWESIYTLDGKRLMGYKDRNIEIARSCDVLYDIEPEFVDKATTRFDKTAYQWETGKFYRRSGGTWTMNTARSKYKKSTYLITIEYV